MVNAKIKNVGVNFSHKVTRECSRYALNCFAAFAQIKSHPHQICLKCIFINCLSLKLCLVH